MSNRRLSNSPLLLGFIVLLRLFVNLDDVTGAPFKLGVSCAIGAVMGCIDGFVRRLTYGRTIGAA